MPPLEHRSPCECLTARKSETNRTNSGLGKIGDMCMARSNGIALDRELDFKHRVVYVSAYFLLPFQFPFSALSMAPYPKSQISRLPSAVCRLPSAVCCLPSPVISHPSFNFRLVFSLPPNLSSPISRPVSLISRHLSLMSPCLLSPVSCLLSPVSHVPSPSVSCIPILAAVSGGSRAAPSCVSPVAAPPRASATCRGPV